MQEQTTIYPNAAVIRRKNKRMTIKPQNGQIYITSETVDGEANMPACQHIAVRDKIRVTRIAFSEDGFLDLINAYFMYLQIKQKQ